MKEEADDYYNYAIMGFFVERNERDRSASWQEGKFDLASEVFTRPIILMDERYIYTRVSSSLEGVDQPL